MKETEYQHRTDSVEEKIELLQSALRESNFDKALSLADSMRQTLKFERQRQDSGEATVVTADDYILVSGLPSAWAHWAHGWEFCKVVVLRETAGLARDRYPVDMKLAFPESQVTDLRREIRVASIAPEAGVLQEIKSQVYGEVFQQGIRICQLVIQASLQANETRHFIVFYGNPLAELPGYPSDLCVEGEGFGLDISNDHFSARLSRQMGQLERLTYSSRLGLELYAGGPGHGEPPNIDWAHDYLSSNKFQKFRLTNWETCPDFEVVRGPLMVKVRRWGFPHCPVHPLFTPSRMHIDVTYSFYSGLPWFTKDGRMDVMKDFEITYLRDDEWVFSGYTFDEILWMDGNGKLHEGEVPAESANDLWGIGFYSKHSRDAFVALFLEHRAENFDALFHAGAPTLHYEGHGQIWSRWAARNEPQFKKGAALIQRNAYLTKPYPEDGADGVEALYDSLKQPIEISRGELPAANAASEGVLARQGETPETAPLKPAIWQVLREIRDEMLYTVDANVVDMGYIYDLHERNGEVQILMTMPHKGRPKYKFIGQPIRDHLSKLAGVNNVFVEHTWEPAWNVNRLNDAGRQAMGIE
ncbi:MAG: iron-sulfur cluster assembly protein [Planctomycetota bacterium]|nr:iron-sulfur cluster assembly protein [Planctomycetota bacterium]